MIDFNKLKSIFPGGLPEAHNVFATVAADLTYQKLRNEVGNAPTNRRVWLNFAEVYAEETRDIPVSSVAINGAPGSLDYTKTAQLSAVVSPVTATDKTVTWKSSDTNVATVSPNGLVTAKSVSNSVTITATAGGVSKSVVITVRPPVIAVSSVAITPKTATLEAGKSVTLVATITPAGATNKNVVWTSSSPTKVHVSATGVVTADPGLTEDTTAVITVTTGDGAKKDTANVSVTIPNEGV